MLKLSQPVAAVLLAPAVLLNHPEPLVLLHCGLRVHGLHASIFNEHVLVALITINYSEIYPIRCKNDCSWCQKNDGGPSS